MNYFSEKRTVMVTSYFYSNFSNSDCIYTGECALHNDVDRKWLMQY